MRLTPISCLKGSKREALPKLKPAAKPTRRRALGEGRQPPYGPYPVQLRKPRLPCSEPDVFARMLCAPCYVFCLRRDPIRRESLSR
jgi:hypothetical protein